MSIDEAIQHCLEKGNECSECGKEHLQLAEWLKEFKTLKEHNKLNQSCGNCKNEGSVIKGNCCYCRHIFTDYWEPKGNE